MRDVAQRIEVIRLAQPLLAEVDQVPSLELPGQPVDPFQPGGDRRVLADVGVDEQRAARLQHPRGFGQHPGERLGRQVFQDVERPCLVECAVRERQPSQIPEHQVDLARAPRARRTGRCRCRRATRRDRGSTAAPARCRIPGPRPARRPPAPGKRAACRSGSVSRAAAATPARAGRRRAAPRPGTWSARRRSRLDGCRGSPPGFRRPAGSPRRPVGRVGARSAGLAVRRRRQDGAAIRAPHEREQAGEIMPRAQSLNSASSRSARRPQV